MVKGWSPMNGENLEGSDGGLIWVTTPIFTWKDKGKPRKTSARIAGLRIEI
jgi:hypothetical protein